MISRDKQKKAQALLLQSWAEVEKDLKQKRLDAQSNLALALAPTPTLKADADAEDEGVDDRSIIDMASMQSSLSHPSTITTNNNNISSNNSNSNPPQPPQSQQSQPQQSQSPLPHHHAAALLVQSVYRGHEVRRVLSAYYAQRTVRIFDPNAGR